MATLLLFKSCHSVGAGWRAQHIPQKFGRFRTNASIEVCRDRRFLFGSVLHCSRQSRYLQTFFVQRFCLGPDDLKERIGVPKFKSSTVDNVFKLAYSSPVDTVVILIARGRELWVGNKLLASGRLPLGILQERTISCSIRGHCAQYCQIEP